MRNTKQQRIILATGISAGLGAIIGTHFLTPYIKKAMGIR